MHTLNVTVTVKLPGKQGPLVHNRTMDNSNQNSDAKTTRPCHGQC